MTMPSKTSGRPKIAYVMSRFPTLTETFILGEMLALERMGVDVEVFPLMRTRRKVNHPECARFVEKAHYEPFISLDIIRANLHYMRRDAKHYFGVLGHVLRHTWGSLNFFVGAIGVFPKSVKFARDMEREGVDHIHAHFANHPAAAGTIITQLTGIPFSFTAHGSDLHKERRMLRQKVEAAAFVAAISQYNQAMIVRECGKHVRGKVHVLHCGIDPAMFVPARHEHREGPLRIITVGSLIEVKGHRHLIEACAILRRRGIDVECTFIGEGKLRRKLEKLAGRLGVGTVVRFLGGKPRQEVARMLQESDLAALTSVQTKDGKREGIPVVLMEAMASGLPVVASWISGVPELVENGRTGLLVPPRDPGGIANAIEKLSGDPALRKQMGAAGREKILREFAVERNVRLLLEAIENVHDACQAQGVAV